jgi:hypothetical protein
MRALHNFFCTLGLISILAFPMSASATLISLSGGTPGDTAPVFNFGTESLTLGGGVLVDIGGNLVYQSQSAVSGHLSVISFSFSGAGVNNILIDVFSTSSLSFDPLASFQLEAGVAQGDPSPFSQNQTRTLGLQESLITLATLTYSDLGSSGSVWDFYIDNIRFDINVDCTNNEGVCTAVIPTPTAFSLLVMALFSLLLHRKLSRPPMSAG